MATYGVLTDTSVHKLVTDGARRRIEEYRVAMPNHIGDICTMATRLDITHFWIMPQFTVTRAFIENADSSAWDVSTRWSNYQDAGHQVPRSDAHPIFARLWKRNTPGRDGHTVLMGLSVKDWRWRDIEAPMDLLGILYYLDCVLKMPVEWSYEHMATVFFQSMVKNPEWLRKSTIDITSVLKGAARDLKWVNPKVEPVLGGFFICYDVNSAYLSGYTGGSLGVGDPVHQAGVTDEKLPGVYRVSIDIATSPFDGKLLPKVFGRSDWLTHDLLASAREAGYGVEVHECWQYPEHHRVVGPTASALWDAREALHPERGDSKRFPNLLCRRNAYESIKRIALPLPGRFANAKTPVYRPDWWECGVGRARATQLRRLLKLREQGFVPAWIYGDSLYFFSMDNNPVTAVPGMLDRQTKLGGYKCNGVIEVTQEVLDTWASATVSGLREGQGSGKLTTMFSRIAEIPMGGE